VAGTVIADQSLFIFQFKCVMVAEGQSGGASSWPESEYRQGVGDFQTLVVLVAAILLSSVLATIIAIAVTKIFSNPVQVVKKTLMRFMSEPLVV